MSSEKALGSALSHWLSFNSWWLLLPFIMLLVVAAFIVAFVLLLYMISPLISPKPLKLNGAHVVVSSYNSILNNSTQISQHQKYKRNGCQYVVFHILQKHNNVFALNINCSCLFMKWLYALIFIMSHVTAVMRNGPMQMFMWLLFVLSVGETICYDFIL